MTLEHFKQWLVALPWGMLASAATAAYASALPNSPVPIGLDPALGIKTTTAGDRCSDAVVHTQADAIGRAPPSLPPVERVLRRCALGLMAARQDALNPRQMVFARIGPTAALVPWVRLS